MIKAFGEDIAAVCHAVGSEAFDRNVNGHRLFGTGKQAVGLLEALQFMSRHIQFGDGRRNIQLDDFLAGEIAGIGDVDRQGQDVASSEA